MDVKRKAESVIKKCGTSNPFEIARRLLPFILAHEIGHALCTPDANTAWMASYTFGNDAKAERTANLFAVELLLNDTYLREHADFGLHELARMCGVPDEYVQLKSQY
ncbi:ImmA/IrrE family metallo-endopeptidase [Mitsuokella jalaludinii]|uniref:ImmA/IrrE family metallo-endopeptidase n=1 Tax=Mitsuokella jalaludinii TaxID=187979 RepID=UPI00307AB96B